jgi:PTH1 family peptidyl-tRNA hydrolase
MGYSLVVGLGNPGREYALTRHSVGFMVVEAAVAALNGRWVVDRKHGAEVARHSVGGNWLIFAKPLSFMNESGMAVTRLCAYYKIPPQKTVIIYDDIAFPVGDYRINARDGTGGHNGVADVLEKIGGGFLRYRIGVGGKLHRQMDLRDHVLSRFSEADLQILNAKMPEILKYLHLLLDKGVEHAMNLANRKKVI